MTMILIFVFAYITLSFWDVAHVNELFDRLVNPAKGHRTEELPPAPRLVIPGQQLPPKVNGGPAA